MTAAERGHVHHDAGAQRFTTREDGVTAFVEYEREGDVMIITHTIVPPEIGGRGIAGTLVAAAFAQARAEGWRVRTQCSYAAAWAAKHPDVQSLLDR